MNLTPKKRLEIILEAPMLNRLLERFRKSDIDGYTVTPALAGKGENGSWSREGLVGDAGQMVVVVCLISEEKIESALALAKELLEHHNGILSVHDVMTF